MTFVRLTALLVLLSAVTRAEAPADSSIWTAALRQMQQARLDTVALEIDSRSIDHHSFNLRIDSGVLYYAVPVHLKSGPVRWAALFRGSGSFRFVPPVSIERDQVRRFYDSDSLDYPITEALVLFDDSIRQVIERDGRVMRVSPDKSVRDAFENFLDPLVRKENHTFTFSALRALVHPKEDPFLLVSVGLKRRGRTSYMYDPYRREPVLLLRDHNIPGERFIELVCSYTTDLDETYSTINGRSSELIHPRHVDIDATIDRGGEYSGRTTTTYDVLQSPMQFVAMALHEELEVDSIVNHVGAMVPFVRWRSKSNKSDDLFVLLESPVNQSDVLTLSYYYHGKIARREVGEYYLDAGASWYPRYGFARRSTYTLRFRTPRELTFIASADLEDSLTVGDTLFTSWSLARPTSNISFNIGWFTPYQFGGPGLPPVTVYYNEPLHRNLLKGSDRNVYKRVGADVLGSLELFSSLFGPFPFGQLVIGEIIYAHGESFPGFIHMGANTFVSTDNWGEDHVFRSHEVAHQWWGTSLGYETYHDQWLSEGFATYASLLYLQQEKGDKRYYDRLKKYADDIFSARKYLLSDGAESGPIILGRRTASTKTRGDYSLIIYKKGALVLHMLRTHLTDWQSRDDSRFFAMLSEFHRLFSGDAASTADFRSVVERHTKSDMGWFFDQWVYRNELPEYRFSYDIDRDSHEGGWVITGRVTRDGGPDSFVTLMPFEIEYRDGRTEYVTRWLDQRQVDVTWYVKSPVKKVTMNPFTAVLARVKQ